MRCSEADFLTVELCDEASEKDLTAAQELQVSVGQTGAFAGQNQTPGGVTGSNLDNVRDFKLGYLQSRYNGEAFPKTQTCLV